MGKMTLSQMVAQLAGGMGTSIQIFVVTLVFSLPLGLIVAFGRMTKNGFLRNLVKVYISIMRGTPPDAAAHGSLFWPLLSFRHPCRKRLPSLGYLYRVCD